MHRRPRILIVDDDEDLRLLLSMRLTCEAMEVTTAADGQEAMESLSRETFDVVVADIMMPRMNGFELLYRLQEWDDRPAVIFLSAMTQVSDRIRGLELGAVDYVIKPFDAPELVARIRAALREKERLDRVRSAAYEDNLTRLGNRRSYQRTIEREIARSVRYGRPFAVTMIDADGLKSVNDALGHAAGDQLLTLIAGTMRATARAADHLFRLGGDEFAVLMPESDGDAAVSFIRRFYAALAQECLEDRLVPSASAGYAVFPEDAGTQAQLERLADEALYREKARRRAVPSDNVTATPQT
ncbi:MAG: diguanylate cyclase [Candidatus Schekmanbacteria bacterium]|nr:diguanylate cyclase [Candidatus Schekmanbacteria bacterium]